MTTTPGAARDSAPTGDRRYDVVVFGATGFTGRLTARYLAEHAPEDLSWAIAGRDPARLAAVRDELGRRHRRLPTLVADTADPPSLARLAESTRVVATTVGPYIRYGLPLVAACAEAGSDYVDLTGEPEFVDLAYLRHHTRAERNGSRIVHACGFESIPYDLGTLFTVRRLPADVPLRVTALVRASGGLSGGTMATILTGLSRARQTVEAARDRHRVEPLPSDRRVRAVLGRVRRVAGVWAIPLPTIDARTVARSAAALPAYGPDFRYSQYAAVGRLPTAAAALTAAGGLYAAARIPPVRRLLAGRVRAGAGPDRQRRDRSWFSIRITGEGGGRRVVTEVAGGDPGYGETAKMLAESAMCLALDDLPETSGQVTTAVAMGDALIGRLVAAGITFREVSSDDY